MIDMDISNTFIHNLPLEMGRLVNLQSLKMEVSRKGQVVHTKAQYVVNVYGANVSVVQVVNLVISFIPNCSDDKSNASS